MRRRTLGATGLSVAPIGLGTVKIGRNSGVKYPRTYPLPDDAQVIELLTTALELGVNLIDTAPAYGNSEARLGRLLPGRRSDWVISTKVGERFVDGRSEFDFSAPAMRASLEGSLRRLRTDYVDLLLLHSDGHDSALLRDAAVLGMLQTARRDGLARAIGISAKTRAGARLGLRATDIVMVEPQVAMGLARGTPPPGRLLVKKAFASGHTVRHEQRARVLAGLLEVPAVGAVIVGTQDPAHLRANVALAEEVSGRD